jgi:DNA-binding XRE family transcriptional regulator
MSTKIRGTQRAAKTAAMKTRKRASSAMRKDSTSGPSKVGFSAVLKDVLGSVPDSARAGFVLSVVGGRDDELDTTLWGKGPGAVERKEAALENLRRQYKARRAVVEASLTRTEAAELLDVSEQAVLDRLEAGDLIGLKKGREWRLPAWQFDPDAERGFVPGLVQLRQVFPGGPVSLTEWATAPNADLDGATPTEELAAGRVTEVVRVAKASTFAAW